jgi:flagellar basal-body rod protein FlgC
MANAETTHTAEGGPYRRQVVVFHAQRLTQFPALLASFSPSRKAARGVRVEQVIADATPPMQRYQPGHPDADAKGYVSYPAIDPTAEMADLLGAVRAYGLNESAVQAAKAMIQQSLDILR